MGKVGGKAIFPIGSSQPLDGFWISDRVCVVDVGYNIGLLPAVKHYVIFIAVICATKWELPQIFPTFWSKKNNERSLMITNMKRCSPFICFFIFLVAISYSFSFE